MTQTTMARPHVPRRALPPLPLIVLAVVGVLLCVGMALALRDPDVVSRVTVENPGPLPVNVDVRPAPDEASLILAPVPADGQAATRDVLDQGDEWIFHFTSGGVDGGTVRVPRSKLAADGWRVIVPESVSARLQSETFVPAYR